MKNSALKGALFVAFGASSYGMLTTFVKLANDRGFSTFELTFSQYFLGFLGVLLLQGIFGKTGTKKSPPKASLKNIRNLMLTGSSLGLTSLIYYFSIQFISVSIAIVLLMQSVWIGVFLDAIVHKTKPSMQKTAAVVVVLLGTVLATNLLFDRLVIDWRGIVLGLLAAISYSVTIFASNRIALELPALNRSKWMTLGALVVVGLICIPNMLNNFHPDVLYEWGVFLGIFGVVLPPLLLNSGMPKLNLGIGAIITSIELPVAVSLAYFILGEKVNIYQWIGIIIILIAVVLMNLKKTKA